MFCFAGCEPYRFPFWFSVIGMSQRIWDSALRFALLAVLLVLLSAALPAYTLPRFGIMASAVLNIVMQVAISFPAMKFWIMPRRSQETVDR